MFFARSSIIATAAMPALATAARTDPEPGHDLQSRLTQLPIAAPAFKPARAKNVPVITVDRKLTSAQMCKDCVTFAREPLSFATMEKFFAYRPINATILIRDKEYNAKTETGNAY